jgi:glutathionyl-hydroquinone reductase
MKPKPITQATTRIRGDKVYMAHYKDEYKIFRNLKLLCAYFEDLDFSYYTLRNKIQDLDGNYIEYKKVPIYILDFQDEKD